MFYKQKHCYKFNMRVPSDLEACTVSWIGMKLKRPLTWNPEKELFVNDAEANAMLSRQARKPEYDIAKIMKKARLG